mmetsp:Transcript_11944/g.32299  ORF Transcript_11944/g.32299 Transcript_11944/m.32299 type:complete len:219 (-) Transcript_11944:337-993(-)
METLRCGHRQSTFCRLSCLRGTPGPLLLGGLLDFLIGQSFRLCLGRDPLLFLRASRRLLLSNLSRRRVGLVNHGLLLGLFLQGHHLPICEDRILCLPLALKCQGLLLRLFGHLPKSLRCGWPLLSCNLLRNLGVEKRHRHYGVAIRLPQRSVGEIPQRVLITLEVQDVPVENQLHLYGINNALFTLRVQVFAQQLSECRPGIEQRGVQPHHLPAIAST